VAVSYEGYVRYPDGRTTATGLPMRIVSVQCHEGRCPECADTSPDDEPYSGPLPGPLDGHWCEHDCGHGSVRLTLHHP
jgi:hypothetical protein